MFGIILTIFIVVLCLIWMYSLMIVSSRQSRMEEKVQEQEEKKSK